MSTPPATSCFTLGKSPAYAAAWMSPFSPPHPAKAKPSAKTKPSCVPLIFINLDDKILPRRRRQLEANSQRFAPLGVLRNASIPLTFLQLFKSAEAFTVTVGDFIIGS